MTDQGRWNVPETKKATACQIVVNKHGGEKKKPE
jgi:hypothetical protein